LCLTLRAKATGADLLTVGGRWDGRAEPPQYIDADDLTGVADYVNDNQIPVVRGFARWLAARIEGKPRTRMIVTGGNRRGGKSWIIVRLAAAGAIAIPNAIIWIVSPTLEKREELERYLRDCVPPEWRTYRARELRFVFPNGSSIKSVTGDDADALKRGEADLVIYNEPQLMTVDVLTNGAPAIIDNGGLVLFAGNPATKRKGIWFTRLWKDILSGKYAHGEVYPLDARDNPDIDKQARSEIGELLSRIAPATARADDEGIFEEPGNHPYARHFDERRHTVPKFPDIADVCTSTVLRLAGCYSKRDQFGGVDFQAGRGNVGVELVATGNPNRPIWYIKKILVREGDEKWFLDDAFEIWDRDRMLWIGDPSGTWQDAEHTKGRNSFDKFIERKWEIRPPREKVTDRGKFPAHPSVSDSINIVNNLLDDDRLIVCLDGAGVMAEALQLCEYSKVPGKESKLQQSVFTDLTDALRYPIYWATPKPGRAKRAPAPGQIAAIGGRPAGPRSV
jgi:hypothetical protein